MKNIHILPTDKPSIIGFDSVKNLHFTNDFIDDYQNIYITSDEEIKEGDWILNETHNIEKAISHYNYKSLSSDCKKIILTTDQDLIKDGVQAIDDEFLEWFVKNPSCEEVETLKVWWSDNTYSYDIILPKEEPKQETQGYICPQTKKQCDDECCVSAKDCHLEASIGVLSEPKQETIEEVAEKFAKKFGSEIDSTRYYAFINGAKWQQERMYSYEEVLEQLNLLYSMKNSLVDTFTDENDYITMKWFEQFKNK